MLRPQFAPLAIRLGLSGRDGLDAAAVGRLVAEGVAEDDQLDFKRAMYANTDHAKDELAKDIAAFANHHGGVLVLGVEERDGRASRLTPFEGGDATIRQVISVHASRVRPLVPDLAVEWVPTSSDRADGYLLVGVPASPLAPHASGNPNDGALRFPTRSGSLARYMSEADVASGYARRIAAIGSSAKRGERLIDDAFMRLVRDEPWIHVALVPHAPGSGWVGAGLREHTRDWIAARALTSVWGDLFMEQPDVEIGHRKVTVGLWSSSSQEVSLYYSDLHADGSALVARQVSQPDHSPPIPGSTDPTHFIAIENLVNVVALSLRLAAMHALENSGAVGTAHIHAGLLPGGSEHARQMVIGSWNPIRVARGTRPLESVPAIDRTVSLDGVALDGSEWMRATKGIVDEIVQCFGLDEVPQITADGALRLNFWGSQANVVAAFAARYGIPVLHA